MLNRKVPPIIARVSIGFMVSSIALTTAMLGGWDPSKLFQAGSPFDVASPTGYDIQQTPLEHLSTNIGDAIRDHYQRYVYRPFFRAPCENCGLG